ncbi:hypothetical protein NP233_g5349 [Leucocoprinus birnbaumii]|uniref:F-box domain-containing protein n=1 Tax=Leucocoprinus birnbaumii TaxID=56174 RepID=A0AAD5VZB2_9AGAR|nr:hypothetical protein NP233_g5349 [Leucocoprinus birnbaumii]
MMPTSPSNTCPRCGHDLEEATKQELTYCSNPGANVLANDIPTLRIQQEDVPRMEAEVERLSTLIRSLNQERAYLLRKINNVRATTRRLPPEILSIIFQLIRPPIDFSSRQALTEMPDDIAHQRDTYDEDEDLQLDLGAVCYQWRQYVWSTPQLWTSISIEIYDCVAENNAAILGLYFQNARSLPMSIELDMRAQLYKLRDAEDAEKRSKVFSQLESIRRTIFVKHAPRIQKLFLLGLPLEWSTCVGPNLSSCQDIALAWPISYTQEAEYDLTGLSQLPSLRRIAFSHLSTPMPAISSSVTTITVQKVTIAQCFVLLTTCPNLLEFKLSSRPMSNFSEIPTGHGERIILPHLKKLHWCIRAEPWSIAFLLCVRFSQLRSLQLTGTFSDPDEEERDALISFLLELPPTLQSVQLNELDIFGQRITIDIITNLPLNVTSLCFTHCDVSAIQDTLRMIGRPSDADDPKVLTSLHTLKISGTNSGGLTYKSVFKLLEAFYTATKDWRQAPFKLVVCSPGCPTELDEKSKKKFRELVDSGFELEVVWEPEPRMGWWSSFEDEVDNTVH